MGREFRRADGSIGISGQWRDGAAASYLIYDGEDFDVFGYADAWSIVGDGLPQFAGEKIDFEWGFVVGLREEK